MVLPFSMVKEEQGQLYFGLCWVVGQQLDPIQTPSHLMEQLLTSQNICHIFNHLVSALCPSEVACWSDSGPWPGWSCQAWVSSNLSPVPRGEGGKPQRLRWQQEQKQKLCFPNPLIWTGHHQSSQPTYEAFDKAKKQQKSNKFSLCTFESGSHRRRIRLSWPDSFIWGLRRSSKELLSNISLFYSNLGEEMVEEVSMR